MVERRIRIAEVGGSNPPRSTTPLSINGYMLKYTQVAARKSKLSSFPVELRLFDPRDIATHEKQRPDAERYVYESMLERGYNGPPIAVFASMKGVIGIADGHHRLKALKQLAREGKLKCTKIPMQIFDAHADIIRIAVMGKDENPLSLKEIEACFEEPNKAIPVCTSHFQTKLSNGDWVRLQLAQPNIVIAKPELLA